MKLILLILTALPLSILAQETPIVTSPPPPPPPVVRGQSASAPDNDVLEFPDVEASFPGGTAGMQEFISKNVIYPPEAIEMNLTGRVYLSFVVEIDGSISQITVERGVDPLLNNEARRLIRAMPKWSPGEYAGQKVRTRCRLPINFVLNNDQQVREEPKMAGTPGKMPEAIDEDRENIRASYYGFIDALNEKYGAKALTFIDLNTIDYYSRILILARDAKRDDVMDLDLADRLNVLNVRHQIPVQEIRKMDGRDLIAYLITYGMIGNNMSRFSAPGNIRVMGNVGRMSLTGNNVESSEYLEFHREQNVWKLDLTVQLDAANEVLKSAAEASGLDENEFLLVALGALSGKRPLKKVWKPVG